MVDRELVSAPLFPSATWRAIPGLVSSDRMGPPFTSHEVKGHLEGGPTTPGIGDLPTRVTNYLQVLRPSWDPILQATMK